MKNDTHIICKVLPFPVPPEAAALLDAARSVTVASATSELVELSVRDAVDGWHEVAYDVPGKGRVVEARVCRVRNGINANYPEAYMRRRDPDCMVIGDQLPTDKPTYQDRFGRDFLHQDRDCPDGALRSRARCWGRRNIQGAAPWQGCHRLHPVLIPRGRIVAIGVSPCWSWSWRCPCWRS